MLKKLRNLKKASLDGGASDTSDKVVFYQSAIYAFEVRGGDAMGYNFPHPFLSGCAALSAALC